MGNALFTIFGKILVDSKKADEEMDKATKKADETSNKMVGLFKKAAIGIGAVFAADKIIDFGKESVEAAATANAIDAQFEQVFDSSSGRAKNMIDEMANDFGMLPNRLKQPYTTFTSMFKGLGLETKESMDLATTATTLSADAAAFYDKSYEDASSSLSSFIKGNYEGGEAIGLYANDTQMAAYAVKNGLADSTKAWAAMDEAQKQSIRIKYAEDMQKKAGATGQAARESGSLENRMGNLKQAWADFLAVVGQPVLAATIPILQGLAGGLANAGSFVGDMFDKVGGWYDAMASVPGLLGAIVTVLGILTGRMIVMTAVTNATRIATALWSGVTKVAAGVQKLFNLAVGASPLGRIITLVTLIVGAFVAFISQNEGMRTKLMEVWETIKSAVGGAMEWIGGAIQTAGAFITAVFSGLWNGLVFVVSGVLSFITSFIRMQIIGWSLIFTTVFNVIKLIVQGAWTAIQFIISAALTVIRVLITAAWTGIRIVIQTVVNVIRTVVITAWNAIRTATSVIFNAIKTVAATVWNGLKTAISIVVNAIRAVVSSAWNFIRSTTLTIFNTIRSIATTVWNGLKTAISTVVNAVRAIVSGAWNFISNTTSRIFNTIRSIATNIWNGILNAIRTPMEKAKSVVSNIIEAIKGFFNFKISWPHIPMPHFSINPSGWQIGDLLKGKIPSLGVDWYANGGIMTDPTAFGMNGNKVMVGGEAGAEAILPLNKRTLGGIGEGILNAMGTSEQTPTDVSGVEQRLDNVTQLLVGLIDAVHKSFTPERATQAVNDTVALKNMRDRLMTGGA